jgi:5-methylcytosine-specific restriction endonuclease McrA
MFNRQTLVLNSDYNPISLFPLSTIPAYKAVTRVLNGTCTIVEEYDDLIKTPNFEMRWPAVVARTHYLNKEKGVVLNSRTLALRDGRKCGYCLTTLSEKEVTIDHVIPKDKKGTHTWENVVTSCSSCNHAKGNKMPNGQWQPILKPYKPTYRKLLNLRKNFIVNIHHESWRFFLGDWKAKVVLIK